MKELTALLYEFNQEYKMILHAKLHALFILLYKEYKKMNDSIYYRNSGENCF